MNTKNLILSLLEQSRGKNISGSFIAEQLNISRNAVWKAINELKKNGHKIESATNRGYCLCADNDILSAQGILPFLSQTLQEQLAEKINVHTSLESTNKTAKELALFGAEHGTIVIADYQSAGKGRYERSFFSPPGCGIYISFILKPTHFCLATPALTTHFAAVTVCEAIEAVSEKSPKIKWVNDVFLNNKKICGISTEAITDFESGNIAWMVVGIGVNFTTPAAGFPENLQKIVGTVFEDAPPTTRNHLAGEIINRILSSEKHADAQILAKYKERLIMLGKNISVLANPPYEATALDIDDTGRLIVKTHTGEIVSLFSGEISIRI